MRSVADVARALDHAVLKPELTAADLERHAAMCVARGVGCLCVRSVDVAAAVRLVAGSPVVVASVIGFPHGAAPADVKALEARRAVAAGARELDMVINIGALRSGADGVVRDDIAAVVAEARPHGVLVKVILETCHLTEEEIRRACRLAEQAGADFVKTSTGFGGGGATVADIALMRRVVGAEMGVKASGGVRSLDDAKKLIAAGADRLGASASVAIVSGATSTGSY